MAVVGRSVQFRGIENAVKAYENQEIPKWGLFQGSQFLSKYEGTSIKEGAELLEQFLSALDLRTADSSTYTLCVYDGLAAGEKIRSNTKYDGSFNFRLVDNIDGYQSGKMSGLEQRLAGMEAQLKEVLDPEAEEDTPQKHLWDAVGKILEHPQVQTLIASKIVGIIDGVGNAISGIFPGMRVPAAIGNVPQDENAKLQQAINLLAVVDPELGTHLLKLAQVAEKDPGKYSSLIGMLNLL